MEEIKNTVNGKILYDDLAIPVKLNDEPERYKVQNTPKLRGIYWCNKNLGSNFKNGTKFKMLYVIHKETDVVCFEDSDEVKDFKIDYLLMIDKNIFQKIKPIFETMKWDAELEILRGYAKNKISGQLTLF